MKSIFNLVIILVFFTVANAIASGDNYNRQIRKGWPKSSVSALKVINKFGEVKINDLGGDSVTIKVLITIDNGSESKAKELMDRIQIDIQKSGALVTAETRFEDSFKSSKSFSIDYLINIPKDRDLDISNKYGNVIINDLTGKGNFEVSYGSMTGGKITTPAGSPARIVINYGKADLETVNNASMEFKYSKLFAGEIGQLNIDTKYSTVNLHKSGSITLDSKYDAISIDEVNRLKSISKYTNYKIGLLTGNFDLNTGYGSVRIDKVDPKFDNILINNSYGGINIGLSDLNYKLKADCDYCDINYPEDRYKGNKIRDNHRFTLDGTIGNGGSPVSITSKYGGVKLTE